MLFTGDVLLENFGVNNASKCVCKAFLLLPRIKIPNSWYVQSIVFR